MSNLKELRQYTKDLSVLYVEDNLQLLKQVSMFLEKLFKTVYTATDGSEGLDSYKQHHQDIILTDLTMPNMDGYTMIKKLKEINNQINIVIISAHSDSENLLEAMHIGVCDFLPKPIDNELFQNILYKVSKNFIKTNLNTQEINSDINLTEQLKILATQKRSIEFINHYKGLPIIHQGYIIDVTDTTIEVYAPYIQVLAIAYQKSTDIESTFLDGTIHTKLDHINHKTREVTLKKYVQIKSSAKNRQNVRIIPNNNITIIPWINDTKLNINLKDLSINSISFETNTQDIALLKHNQTINLTFSIVFNSNQNSQEKTEIIYATGNIFNIKQDGATTNVVITFKLDKLGETILQQYISNRELELIDEFKQLERKYIV